MQVKRYEAASVRDALAKIKKDMGPDAIVLSSKRLPGEKKIIEVLAAKDGGRKIGESVAGDIEKNLSGKAYSFADREMLGSFRTEIEELKALIQGVKRENLYQEFTELKDSMNAFFDVLGLRNKGEERSALSRIYYQLVSRGVSRAQASKMLDEIKRGHSLQDIQDYEKCLKIAEGILQGSFIKKNSEVRGKRVKVFLGPTGVGKTTTLAKLAARYALEKKLAVGLISTDTYRIAAPEQLKVYARIIGLPLEVADEKDTFRQAMDRFSEKDVILVDTPGRSREETDYLSKLKDVLYGDGGDVESNLLLSLTSSREHLLDAALRFEKFGCDNIIFTKLDECTRYGVLCDVVGQTNKPVSYITTGQNVPQDIERADPVRLAELIMRH